MAEKAQTKLWTASRPGTVARADSKPHYMLTMKHPEKVTVVVVTLTVVVVVVIVVVAVVVAVVVFVVVHSPCMLRCIEMQLRCCHNILVQRLVRWDLTYNSC